MQSVWAIEADSLISCWCTPHIEKWQTALGAVQNKVEEKELELEALRRELYKLYNKLKTTFKVAGQAVEVSHMPSPYMITGLRGMACVLWSPCVHLLELCVLHIPQKKYEFDPSNASDSDQTAPMEHALGPSEVPMDEAAVKEM
jgi:hypothetical protein